MTLLAFIVSTEGSRFDRKFAFFVNAVLQFKLLRAFRPWWDICDVVLTN